MNGVESRVGCGERGEWSTGVAMDLRTLTLEAGVCPPADIGIHSRPYIAGGNESLRCPDAGVGQSMEGVKHGTLDGLGEGSRERIPWTYS